jgi:hypothetical protein
MPPEAETKPSPAIKFPRKHYMFAIVTESEADDDFKAYLHEELDLDSEQCAWVPKRYDEDVESALNIDLKSCNPNCVIFAFAEKVNLEDDSIGTIEIEDEITDEIKEEVCNVAIQDFPHLHLHDEYSLRDGLGTAQQRADLMVERGWTYLTATNHGSLGGWVKQYVLSKKLGLKPIFGVEAYLNRYRNLPREDYKDMDDDMKIKYRRNNHQILLARTMEGWFNIIEIQNDAELNGFYYKPRTDPDFLMKHGKGVIGTSTDGGAGEIPIILRDESIEWEKRLELAKELYDFYCEAFDDYYLELNLIDWDEQIETNRALIAFGEWVGAKYVVTTDAHYLRKEDAEAHDILLMIRDNKTMVDKALGIAAQHMMPALEAAGLSTDKKSDEWKEENDLDEKKAIVVESLAKGREFLEKHGYKDCFDKYDESAERIGKGEEEKALKEDSVWEFEIKDFYFKTLDDFYNSWEKLHGPEDDIFTEDIFWRAVRNTRGLVRSVENFEIDTSIKLPKMAEDSLGALKEMTRKGMDRLGFTGKQEYEDRLDEEFEVIEKLDFADYFLIFRKIVEYCQKEKIFYGPGRGCFHPNSRVVMANGISKFIEDIKPGDMVVTHDGSHREVLETYDYDVEEELLELEMDDGRKIICTKDHKILVRLDDGEEVFVAANEIPEGAELVDI